MKNSNIVICSNNFTFSQCCIDCTQVYFTNQWASFKSRFILKTCVQVILKNFLHSPIFSYFKFENLRIYKTWHRSHVNLSAVKQTMFFILMGNFFIHLKQLYIYTFKTMYKNIHIAIWIMRVVQGVHRVAGLKCQLLSVS